MPERLVNGFQRISIEEAKKIKIVNKCEKMKQSSPRWEIYYGLADEVMLPPPLMRDLVKEMMLNQIPRQAIVIFESSGEAYVVVCLFNFQPEILKVATLRGSEAAFAMISQLASEN